MAIQADPTWRIVQEFAKAHWSPDGTYIYLRFSGSTYAVPLQRGSMLPPAPSEGFLSKDAVAAVPGARLISEAADVQAEGGDSQDLEAGDAVVVTPGERHWHGAAPWSSGTHIAVNVDAVTVTTWLEAVSDEEYAG